VHIESEPMFAATTTMNATPIEVFQYWDDVESWPLWNSCILDCCMPAGLCFGSKGWISTLRGSRRRVHIAHIDYPRSLTIEFPLPFGKLVMESRFKVQRGYTEATIEGRFTGPFRSFHKSLYAVEFEQFAKATLLGLKDAAEFGLNTINSAEG